MHSDSDRKRIGILLEGDAVRSSDFKRLEDNPIAESSTTLPISEAVSIAYDLSAKSSTLAVSTNGNPIEKSSLMKSSSKIAALGIPTLTGTPSKVAIAMGTVDTPPSSSLRLKETDLYVKKIAAIAATKPGLLSKTAMRAIARTKPASYFELAAIKGVGKERASLLKQNILPLFVHHDEKE
jgi:hypothetical protein